MTLRGIRYSLIRVKRQLQRFQRSGWKGPLLTTVVPLGAVFFADLLTQAWADSLVGPTYYGFLGIVPAHDASFFFGSVHDLSVSLITGVSSTMAVFMALLFLVIHWSLPTPSPLLRAGMSMFLGGILGHAAFRCQSGHVVNFLMLGTRTFHTSSVSAAGFAQVFGASLILADGWIHSVPFRHREVRGSWWVNPRFQLKFCAILMSLGGLCSIMLTAFGYYFLQAALDVLGTSIGPADKAYLGRVVEAFGVIAVLMTTVFLITLFFVGVIQSHRVAGPLYAFERFLDGLFMGKNRRLKLRTGDEFMHLEELAAQLLEKFEVPKANAELAKAVVAAQAAVVQTAAAAKAAVTSAQADADAGADAEAPPKKPLRRVV